MYCSRGPLNNGPPGAPDPQRVDPGLPRQRAVRRDPVKVTGTSTQPGPADGDIYDWTYSYDNWQTLSAL
jgi:hypothetical protein